jgi:hypothetical protein
MKAKVNICLFEVLNFVSREHRKYFFGLIVLERREICISNKKIFLEP